MIKTGRVEGKETGTLEMSGTLNDLMNDYSPTGRTLIATETRVRVLPIPRGENQPSIFAENWQ